MPENKFPNNLNYILEEKKITVKSLLEITGHSSESLISMWKNGDRQIMTPDLVKIGNKLGYTIDELLHKDLKKIDIYNNEKTPIERLFDKSKDILSDDDIATIEFIMNKTIDNYEKNKKE